MHLMTVRSLKFIRYYIKMAGRVTYFGHFFMIQVSYEVCERNTFLSKWWGALPAAPTFCRGLMTTGLGQCIEFFKF